MVLGVIIWNEWKWGSPGNVISVVTITVLRDVPQRNLWKPYFLNVKLRH